MPAAFNTWVRLFFEGNPSLDSLKRKPVPWMGEMHFAPRNETMELIPQRLVVFTLGNRSFRW